MNSNYTVDSNSGAIWSKDNIVAVFNYHYINLVQLVSYSNKNNYISGSHLIGAWKIKKCKV